MSVAYAVGRHVGGAVVRNRCRRRLRVIAAEASPDLAPGAYLIGVGRGVCQPSLWRTEGTGDRDDAAGERGDPMNRATRAGRSACAAFIRLYQAARLGKPSPCRFVPSCSAYAVEAIETHGVFRGGLLALRRIGRFVPPADGASTPCPVEGRGMIFASSIGEIAHPFFIAFRLADRHVLHARSELCVRDRAVDDCHDDRRLSDHTGAATRSMMKMRLLAPELKKIQARYKTNPRDDGGREARGPPAPQRRNDGAVSGERRQPDRGLPSDAPAVADLLDPLRDDPGPHPHEELRRTPAAAHAYCHALSYGKSLPAAALHQPRLEAVPRRRARARPSERARDQSRRLGSLLGTVVGIEGSAHRADPRRDRIAVHPDQAGERS